jgi:hypothetical protein
MAYHTTTEVGGRRNSLLLPLTPSPFLITGYTHTVIMMDILDVLGAYAKLLKAAISSVTSACPSILMGQLDSHWTDFHETDIRVFL